MEIISNYFNLLRFDNIEKIIFNKYFQKYIFNINNIDENTKDTVQKIKIFVNKIEKYKNDDKYPLFKKTKYFIQLLYYIRKYLKEKNILKNLQKDIKQSVLYLSLIYKYLKKYNDLIILKDLIKVNEKPTNFLNSLYLSPKILEVLENNFMNSENNNNLEKNNSLMENIIPFAEKAIIDVESKNEETSDDDFITSIINYKNKNNKINLKPTNLKEITESTYSIDKTDLLRKLNKKSY